MATKKCPMCAEEIQAEALICRYCGTRLETGAPTGAAAPPPPPSEGTAPPAMPQGELREGIVPSGLQQFGFYLHALVAVAALLIAVFGWGGGVLGWAERGLDRATAGPAFVGGIIVALIAWSIGVRALVPRGTTGAFGRGAAFRHSLKARFGVSQLLRRRGIAAGVIVTALVWAGLEAGAVYYYQKLTDEGWTIRPGLYAALILPAVGIVAALLLLGRGRQIVRMDTAGTIYE